MASIIIFVTQGRPDGRHGAIERVLQWTSAVGNIPTISQHRQCYTGQTAQFGSSPREVFSPERCSAQRGVQPREVFSPERCSAQRGVQPREVFSPERCSAQRGVQPREVFSPEPFVILHHERSRNVPDGHFYVLIFSESKFYTLYNDENHFQIRELVAELHVFEFGCTTFATFEKTCLKS